MSQKKYDSTVARIAGNILSGTPHEEQWDQQEQTEQERDIVAWAVRMARAIVSEVERTEQPVSVAAVDPARAGSH